MYKRVYDVCMLFSEQSNLHNLMLKFSLPTHKMKIFYYMFLPMVNFPKLCYVHSYCTYAYMYINIKLLYKTLNLTIININQHSASWMKILYNMSRVKLVLKQKYILSPTYGH